MHSYLCMSLYSLLTPLCSQDCEGEWFHYPCVGILEGTLPGRVAKWFCPPCRKKLNLDERGNPLEPPVSLAIMAERSKRSSR